MPTPTPLPVTLKPAVLTGETWERLRQSVTALPDGSHTAVIIAASYGELGQPGADALVVHRFKSSWYVMGSVGFFEGKPRAAVTLSRVW